MGIVREKDGRHIEREILRISVGFELSRGAFQIIKLVAGIYRGPNKLGCGCPVTSITLVPDRYNHFQAGGS